jgi:hypothetical protein
LDSNIQARILFITQPEAIYGGGSGAAGDGVHMIVPFFGDSCQRYLKLG